jgi:hypothetical protein
MKKWIFILVAISASFLTGCDEDLAATPLNNPPTEFADGEWHLVQVTGSIAGINHIYEPETITWTFNDDGTVDVINTNTNDSMTDFLDTGTYEFSFEVNDDAPEMCASVMFIENVNYGCQEIDGNEMTLTNTWADGYELRFTKME